ncbi:MAG: flagellar export chaperone FliS [Angelakisella sp.]
MYNNNSYETYRQQSVMTMTHGEMLTKLYDEVIKQINSAVRSIDEKDIVATNRSLQKAQRILGYLDSTLDMRYQISESLTALYEFFIHQTITANVSKDASLLTEILPMIVDLRDAFSQAEKLTRMGQGATVSSNATLMSAVG